MIEIPISNTDNALITGDTPSLIIEYILSGRVEDPGPATKNVVTKSSNESVTDIKNPDIIPGSILGITTFVRVCHSVAPRS